jgi:hypothetical protein
VPVSETDRLTNRPRETDVGRQRKPALKTGVFWACSNML